MDRRKRLGLRLHRALLYWGLLRHPRGRAAAREQYTPTGKRRDQDSPANADAAGDRSDT
ncbi:hypothetical protein Natpe_4007 (plasmid) [Natrinema pellirubrum DSM 15624]|uniref:Uncharacterized protein n=1 Tax=Natrinema pellirubrum (strain DSM 15624 / CIP 106293 / JCM 10476 / NCIMB 786 / 157) TaxID=797303 RepID=L0JTL5_NATP1|nr:hypothetical protein [Natrinema pellirubrum]AGB33741.1 hypothetical protein Natpe_4007 [Natrinema pellirubrum DSM 15624]